MSRPASFIPPRPYLPRTPPPCNLCSAIGWCPGAAKIADRRHTFHKMFITERLFTAQKHNMSRPASSRLPRPCLPRTPPPPPCNLCSAIGWCPGAAKIADRRHAFHKMFITERLFTAQKHNMSRPASFIPPRPYLPRTPPPPCNLCSAIGWCPGAAKIADRRHTFS